MGSYPLRAVDDSFLETAPIVVHADVVLDAPREEVWKVLESDRMWSWVSGIDRLEWLSPRPLEEGCVRRLRVAKLLTVDEEFYRWDAPNRATFRVTRASLPIVSAIAEDFVLDDHAGKTRLTWTMAIEPAKGKALPLGLLAPLLRPGHTKMLAGMKKLVGKR